MIGGCFRHIKGIGEKTERTLRLLGVDNWEECLCSLESLGLSPYKKELLLHGIQEGQQALEQRSIEYFVRRFPVFEHWRILQTYFDHATFVDIETNGLSHNYHKITVACGFRQGRLFTFVEDENLEDFLDFIEESELLVAFNGFSFDFPFIQSYFHLPELLPPKLDLRWIAYHLGHTGGLKGIERKLGIKRPDKLKDITGEEAVELYRLWQEGDLRSKNQLIQYCEEDTRALFRLAKILLP